MKYLLLLILAILWAACALDRPMPTAEFIRQYCPDAVTDTEMEECTGARY
jgi:hypothetical protein